MAEDEVEITRLLNEAGAGRSTLGDDLVAALSSHLRQLARAHMARQGGDHTLQPTALVHEAWMKLRPGEHEAEWDSRRQFFAAAIKAMRSVLVDHARARLADKRGGGKRPVSIEVAHELTFEDAGWVLEMKDVLELLEREDADLAELVQLRFFAGMSHEEIAAHQQVTVRTVERRWRAARLWLLDKLSGGAADPGTADV
ncbi:MAG: ECF-type sigma factor [Planctomycetota bacterium]